MNAPAYLERIGYHGDVSPTQATLDRLIDHHLSSVPFENLDIVRLNRPIVLEDALLFSKIVGERRGGFCFELNGLFATLLSTLGYDVTRGYGVWPTQEGGWVDPFEHIVLSVALPDQDQRFLVDVGFGANCPVVAVPLRDNEPRPVQHHELAAFRAISKAGEPNGWRIEAQQFDGTWILVYEVDLTPYDLEPFAAQCHRLQTSPDSHFTQNLICSRPIDDGRATLGGGRFILTRNGTRDERPVDRRDEELTLLREWFDIEIDPERYGVAG